jgi:hypothetical protein
MAYTIVTPGFTESDGHISRLKGGDCHRSVSILTEAHPSGFGAASPRHHHSDLIPHRAVGRWPSYLRLRDTFSHA